MSKWRHDQKLVLILMVSLVATLDCGVSSGEQTLQEKLKGNSSDTEIQWRGPMCGLNALWAGARTIGIVPLVKIEDVIQADFISAEGSSSEQLYRAAQRFGCIATPFSGFSLDDLRNLNQPAILHVTSSGPGTPFRHWSLFLGIDSEGRFIVQDPPYSEIAYSSGELNSNWDGNVLLISNKPTGIFERVLANGFFVRKSFPVLFCCIFIVVLDSLIRQPIGIGRRLCLIIMCGLLLSFLRNLSDDGFLKKSEFLIAKSAINSIEPINAPEIAIESFLPNENKYLVFDTRLADSYHRGTIPGAVNVPVTTPQSLLLRLTREIPKESPIVLFCQSKGCHFSDLIARRLAAIGFQNLHIYREGYAVYAQQTSRAN
jgi:rhodanese-related sulfurtransferase